ncbi:hypothetical protein D5086_024229 [Populus alba]|uniref:Uncharacterized protein n=1 Tax=Populus alba TaxID=43335 RepID=A0ACC4B5G8_POPAL
MATAARISSGSTDTHLQSFGVRGRSESDNSKGTQLTIWWFPGKGRKEFRLTKYREHVNRISIHYPSVIRSSRPINWMRPHSQFLSYRTHIMNKDRGRDGMILSA